MNNASLHHDDPANPSIDASKGAGGVIVKLQDVHVSFGAQRVLRGVDLDLVQGQTTVIVGPSGTGKSVLC